MSIIYLALGTNLGDRPANLRAACAALSPSVRVLAESRVYQTPPWGYENQPAFLNMAVKGETGLEPGKLLKRLKGIEVEQGREPTFRYGPRRIDLDILFYDDLILNRKNLVIPHPRLQERAFVLVPLNDIASEYRHPVNGETVREMLGKVNAEGIELF